MASCITKWRTSFFEAMENRTEAYREGIFSSKAQGAFNFSYKFL